MTKEEFVASYTERSGLTGEEYHSYFVAVPCRCDYPNCQGWASLSRIFVKHLLRYLPEEDYLLCTEFIRYGGRKVLEEAMKSDSCP